MSNLHSRNTQPTHLDNSIRGKRAAALSLGTDKLKLMISQ
jgi:hypothetical protein